MKHTTWHEIKDRLAPEAIDETLEKAARNKATHFVLFENLQFDSSAFGQLAVLLIGPSCTYKTIDEIEGQHLGDLPSQRKYPVAYCEAPGAEIDRKIKAFNYGFRQYRDGLD